MISAEDLGGLLFSIHHHDEEGDLIYREDDVIALLKKLGFPEPIWGKSINIDDYVMEVDRGTTTGM